ncbi:MAG: class I SAM-dependent methyltransferase [Candidatus Aenigmatarchaeota archaeon]
MLRIYKEHPSDYQIQKYWSTFIKHNCNKILDAGCGVGWFGKFKPARVEVYGIDYNPERVKIASRYEISIVGDIRSLPYKNNFFDGIFCHHVLEHLEDPKKAVNEFFRVLKRGGIVIAEVPSKWDPNVYRDATHKQFFTIESLLRIFEEAGFKILDSHYCALEIKTIKSKLLYEVLSSIGRGFAKRIKKRRRAIRVYAEK